MAAALTFQRGDTPDPNREKLSPADQHIMQTPYAEALRCMGYKSDLIVYAVKMLQHQQKVLEVGRIMLEVEKLEEMEKRGQAFPSLTAESCNNSLRSDGESDSNSDFADAQEPEEFADARAPDCNDLQCDGEQSVVQNKAQDMTQNEVREVQLSEPRVNENQVQDGMELSERRVNENQVQDGMELSERRVNENHVHNRTEPAALLRKLKALRCENQMLKAKQMCKNCRHRPVSITFLPCGHYAYCYDCGQKFGACPICRKTILADVRTFLA